MKVPFSDRFLPDKAIDLVDEAGSRVCLRHAQLPEEARELEKELRQITKEKNEAVRSQDFEKAGELRDREMDLKAQISTLVDKGKEMSKAETEAGDVGPLVTELDIQHIVSSWTSIPVEKVSIDVFNMMLQILEDGRLTDSKGRTVDFKNTLLIMTSNVGSSVIEKGGRRIGFDLDYDEKDSNYNRIKSLVTEELKQYFRPEFLNRLEEMIVFRQLTKLEVKDIADIMLKEVFERLKTKEIELQVTERFRDRVVDEGYNPSYGARPLRRAIMRLLEDSMAEKMLAREIKEGDSVIVDVDSDGNVTVLKGSSGSPESLPEPEPIPV